MNTAWHERHRLSRRASVDERIAWHRLHQEQCACRPVPRSLLARISEPAASSGRGATRGSHARLRTAEATAADVAEIAALRTAVAERLTREHGRGHWSSAVGEAGVLRGLEDSRVFVARRGASVVGTFRLATKKPWAIDPSYFAPVRTPLYLHDMAVTPESQREGVGRALVEAAKVAARAWPAGAIRLDAYDHAAGAGAFYAKCGFEEVGRVTYREVPLVYFQWEVT